MTAKPVVGTFGPSTRLISASAWGASRWVILYDTPKFTCGCRLWKLSRLERTKLQPLFEIQSTVCAFVSFRRRSCACSSPFAKLLWRRGSRNDMDQTCVESKV